MKTLGLAVALLLALAGRAAAIQPGEALRDPAAEARARAISAELRCLVCQNQSIDDSDAPLAQDLRRLVRERIAAGDDDTAVVRRVVERYGNFVLLRPPVTPATWLLWGAPLLLLGGGIWLARRASRSAPPPALDQAEEAQLHALTAERVHD